MANKIIPELTKRIVDRFWSHIVIQPNGCWEWRNALFQMVQKDRYPRFGIGYDVFAANRVAYRIYYGEDLGELVARHKCDNPPCVNPLHLEKGTKKENSEDMVRRGRSATGARHRANLYPDKVLKGDGHGSAVLAEDDVIEIRRLHREEGVNHTQLSRIFGTTRSNIQAITHYRSWKHIE